MRLLNVVIAILLFLLAATPASLAQYEDLEPQPKRSGGIRTEKSSGFDGMVGGPFPAVVGFSGAFNFGDDVRLTGGSGTAIEWAVYSLDLKFFLSPDNWAGYFGVGLTYMVGNPGEFLIWDLDIKKSFVPYIQFGVDYQSDIGVHVLFGVSSGIPSAKIVVMPNIAVGWYF
jgi:hypothetical protein